jgi:proteic killer suppression protein
LTVLTARNSIAGVIDSFRCADTQAMFFGKRIARFANIQAAAMRRLAILNRAEKTGDLRIPPGNRLEQLSGDRAGQWNIRINDQWRICFRFENGDALDVEIADYH